MECSFKKYTLQFKEPGGTSRGTLLQKDTYFIQILAGEKRALGECNLFKNLSSDDRPGYEEKLAAVCNRLLKEQEGLLEELTDWPSIRMGAETALRDLQNGCRRVIFKEAGCENGFTIPINGLIWMGTQEKMKERILSKIEQGYTNIKLKIGGIDFEKELTLLSFLREAASGKSMSIRLDANGAFTPGNALEKLKRLSAFDIEYIEQPIRPGQWQEMAMLISKSPVKIALDEELIGIHTPEQKKNLIDTLQPPLLILKPALTGGFTSCDEWMELALNRGGDFVITSALESNIGLNSIAQYAATKRLRRPQGLGTGQLFTNNFPSPYLTDAQGLHYNPAQNWDLSQLK